VFSTLLKVFDHGTQGGRCHDHVQGGVLAPGQSRSAVPSRGVGNHRQGGLKKMCSPDEDGGFPSSLFLTFTPVVWKLGLSIVGGGRSNGRTQTIHSVAFSEVIEK
jgi:hypothetical protein